MKHQGRRAVRTLSVALFLLGWQAASMLNVRRQFLNPILFPSPLDMVRAGYEESAEGILWRDIAASLTRVFLGFGIGVGMGGAFGQGVKGTELAFYTPWWLLPIVGAAIVLICILASIFSVRKVVVLEPAVVFRG